MISSSLFAQLTAPNGITYRQPLGLFINNEFVAAQSGQTIAAINPLSVKVCILLPALTLVISVTNLSSHESMPPGLRMLISPFKLPATPSMGPGEM